MRGRCSVMTNSPPVKSRPGSDSKATTCSGKTQSPSTMLMQAHLVSLAQPLQARQRPRLAGGAIPRKEFRQFGRIAQQVVRICCQRLAIGARWR